MKVYLDCFPCFVRQALEAARMASNDERQHRVLLDLVMQRLTQLPLDVTPPQVGQIIHRLIREHVTDGDPYLHLKQLYNKRAMEMLPDLRQRMLQGPDPLLTACKLAIAGNQIDFGALSGEFDLDALVADALSSDFAIDAYPRFRTLVDNASRILYLGDNAGEIVFDRLLLEALNREGSARIDFVVRGRPVLNDATAEDAAYCGIDLYANVLSNGSDAPATVLDECSPRLRHAFDAADLVIAKGQGNYESLSEQPGPVFFLLKAKCPVVARDLGTWVGAAVLMESKSGARQRS